MALRRRTWASARLGGAAQAGTEPAQDGVAIVPEVASRGVTAEKDFGSRGGPVKGAAEFAGESG